MDFKEWLNLLEGVGENFDKWLENFRNNAADSIRSEVGLLVVPEDKRRIIADVLGEWSRKPVVRGVKMVREDENWFRFALGYMKVKPNMFREDLERALEVTLRLMSSNVITNVNIGSIGWYGLGKRAKEEIDRESSQPLSKTAQEKLAKGRSIISGDSDHVRVMGSSGGLVLYYLPPLEVIGSEVVGEREKNLYDKLKLQSRHRVLCSYGVGTNWCTASATGDYHEMYGDVGIYILHYLGKARYQFSVGEARQFMDINDDEVRVMLPYELHFLKSLVNVGGIKEFSGIGLEVSASNFVGVLDSLLEERDVVVGSVQMMSMSDVLIEYWKELEGDNSLVDFLSTFSIELDKKEKLLELVKRLVVINVNDFNFIRLWQQDGYNIKDLGLEGEVIVDKGLLDDWIRGGNSFDDLGLSSDFVIDSINDGILDYMSPDEIGFVAREAKFGDDLARLYGGLKHKEGVGSAEYSIRTQLSSLDGGEICDFVRRVTFNTGNEFGEFMTSLFANVSNAVFSVVEYDDLLEIVCKTADDVDYAGIKAYRYLFDFASGIRAHIESIVYLLDRYKVDHVRLVDLSFEDIKERRERGEDISPVDLALLFGVFSGDNSSRVINIKKKYLNEFIYADDSMDADTLAELIGNSSELADVIYDNLENPHMIDGSDEIWNKYGK